MQHSTPQQPVTVSSLLGLMALAIAAGRSKARAREEAAHRDACDLRAARDGACCPRPEAAAG